MANFEIEEELLPSVYLVRFPKHKDGRGSLGKIFNNEKLREIGIQINPAEIFFSSSKKNVIRGMHYQEGKAAHEKLVCCTRGSVLDVIVDIRPESRYFNKPVSVKLQENESTMIIIGKGYAHGFLALQEHSQIIYATTTVHQPSLDSGVLWSSIDYEWPTLNPILSQRDMSHRSIESLK